MYNLVYGQWMRQECSKIGKSESIMNLAGEIVSSEEESFGEKVTKILKYPEYTLFALMKLEITQT